MVEWSEEHERFQALLARHAGILGKITSVYAHAAEDRRDLAQEITMQLWRAFASFDPARAAFSTWMYRIALNVAISQLRRARPTASLDDEQVAAPPIDGDDRLVALHGAVAALPPLDRALILLYLDGTPHAEIAGSLGITETNVATKLTRLKQQLRAALTKGR